MVTITVWLGFQSHYNIWFKVNNGLYLPHPKDLKRRSCNLVPWKIPNIVRPKQCVPKEAMYCTDRKTYQVLGTFASK